MNRILILLIGVLIISCNQSKKGNSKKDKNSTELIEISENFDWLLGNWKRNNEEVGKETFENWNKINALVSGDDLEISFEFDKIE